MTPEQRIAVDKARAALATYRGPRSEREAVVDLVADLMHFCDSAGLSAADVIMAARMHHDAERALAADIRGPR